eukprot:7051217-Pyramimonas_sp.AAC.1
MSVWRHHRRSSCVYRRRGYFGSPTRQPGGTLFVKVSRAKPDSVCVSCAIAPRSRRNKRTRITS